MVLITTSLSIPHVRKLPITDRIIASFRRTVVPMSFVLLGAMFFHEMKQTWMLRSSGNSIVQQQQQLRSRLHHDGSFDVHHDQCRYYLAESAIPDGGLGLFTVVGIAIGNRIGPEEEGDMCIHISHAPKNIMLDSHTWGSGVFYGQFEGPHVRSVCEGFTSFANTMPKTAINTILHPMQYTSPAGLFRQTQPGAGAITHYHGVTAIAMDNIPAGEEITVDYGDWTWDNKKLAKYQRPSRDPSYIRQNGWCVDNIVIRPATDRSMGRGAFATRPMTKGHVVAPAPLQLFPNRSAFTAGPQNLESLFVNYCYQPAGTNMLLFPYGPGVGAINHNHRSPNVALRWVDALENPLHQGELLNLPAKKFWKQTHPGNLILEVVALRDIAQNEELFLDYGLSWERAWNDHVRNWRPPLSSDPPYAYPSDMDETLPIRTVEEQKTEPYAPNLITSCATPDWDRMKSNTIIWKEPKWPIPTSLVYCHILKRYTEIGVEHGDEVYEVLLNFDFQNVKYNPSLPAKKQYIDRHVPRRAIRFVNKPYQSDQHLATAFRHPIELPDELIPPKWKSSDFR
jgi:hypothetical protein